MFPDTVQSKGFHPVVNVTDLSQDFKPSTHNTYISSIHVGPPLNLLGNTNGIKNARAFYTKGTYNGHPAPQDLTTVSDGGTPATPYGISLKPNDEENVSLAHLDAGPGDATVALSLFAEPYSYLSPETFVACKEPLAYYGGKEFVIFKQARTTITEDGGNDYNIPKGCVPVRFLPEATKLNTLPPGSIASHDLALESRVYKNVKSIKWSKYA